MIGLPGLALYFIGRELGITATIVPAALDPHWWTVPVLILQALKNAVLEEVIVVGYLVTRLKGLGWQAPAIIGPAPCCAAATTSTRDSARSSATP